MTGVRAAHISPPLKSKQKGEKMMKKFLCILLALVMVMAMLSGCGGNNTTNNTGNNTTNNTGNNTTNNTGDTGSDDASTSKEGGTLKIGVSSEHTHTMDLFTLTGASTDYYYSWPVYESLFKPNAEGTVDPWLLESYEMDKDAVTYTFHIREGITFSDGTTFDAEALKWNLDHYMEVGAKVESLMLYAIESVEVVDEYTVQLNMNTWVSIIPYAFSREPGYMTSPTYYEENGAEYVAEHPCGTGPFVLTEWDYDVSKRFEARDDYWGGDVKLDAVEYIIYTDSLVATAALQSGEIDVYLSPDTETANAMAANGASINTCAVKSHTYMLYFNSLNLNGNDPTGDVLVRQAICYAIDADALVKAVWGDYALVRNQFGVGEFFYSDEVQGYDYDPDKAMELLAEAGYADGFTIPLKTSDSTAMKNAATIIAQYLADVGITAEIQILSGADFSNAEAGWGDGMLLNGSSVYVSVPMQMLIFRKDVDGHVIGLTNLLRTDDVDAAIAASVSAASDEEAAEYIGEANRLLTDGHCIFYNLAEVPTLFAVNDYVKDSGIGETFFSVADLANAWLDK